MKNNMKIYKEITRHTAREEFYKMSENFGSRAAFIFIGEKGKTQLSNLQNIANSSSKVTDTIDYIKRQIGHGNRGFEKDNFGNDLIKYLFHDLASIRNLINSDLAELNLDDYDQQQIHLLICRQFINSMVIHYNYRVQESGHE
jgi:hypothetical protein